MAKYCFEFVVWGILLRVLDLDHCVVGISEYRVFGSGNPGSGSGYRASSLERIKSFT